MERKAVGSAKAWRVPKPSSVGLGEGAALQAKPSELMRERASATVFYLTLISPILNW